MVSEVNVLKEVLARWGPSIVFMAITLSFLWSLSINDRRRLTDCYSSMIEYEAALLRVDAQRMKHADELLEDLGTIEALVEKEARTKRKGLDEEPGSDD